jgi:hypothetical protein
LCALVFGFAGGVILTAAVVVVDRLLGTDLAHPASLGMAVIAAGGAGLGAWAGAGDAVRSHRT